MYMVMLGKDVSFLHDKFCHQSTVPMNRGSHPDTGKDFYVVIIRVFAEHGKTIASI